MRENSWRLFSPSEISQIPGVCLDENWTFEKMVGQIFILCFLYVQSTFKNLNFWKMLSVTYFLLLQRS